MNVRLISRTTSAIPELEGATPEEILIYIARVSSDREDKRENHAKLLRYLLDHAHFSPFEQVSFTFEIVTNRVIAQQLTRHRSFVFQMTSQRYLPGVTIQPVEFRASGTTNRQSSSQSVGRIEKDPEGFWWASEGEDPDIRASLSHAAYMFQQLEGIYQDLIEGGVAAETARMILPGATETTLYMTGNLRSWIHLLAVRDHTDAQGEVQEIARTIKDILITECPVTAEALDWT